MDLAGALALGDRALVSFVGAGGKKTAMARLVAEATERGRRAGYTTTTHVPPPAGLPLVVAEPEGLDEALARATPPVAFARSWVAHPERADRKLRGFDPAVVDRVHRSGAFDWLAVKADGARRRPFKAPGPDEPSVPDETTLVVPVVGVSAVGRPLSTDAVHRVDRVAAATGLDPGDPIDAAAVGAVLASPEGGLKGVPPGATVVPLVNQADTPELRRTARAALEHAFAASDRFERGLVTSFEAEVCEVVTPADPA